MPLSTVTTQAEWRQAIEALPSTPDNIPAFFLAHGSPFLAFPESEANMHSRLGTYAGPTGPLATFLKDFGPALLKKYQPKGIVVFSAHWETHGTRLVTDYGDENPLLMDYFGFQPSMYELKFKSRGDANLSRRVVQLYQDVNHALVNSSFETDCDLLVQAGQLARTTSKLENLATGTDTPVHRAEGILIISGGLTFHNLGDFTGFAPDTCKPVHRQFDRAVFDAVTVPDADKRKDAMVNLVRHPGFRASHPREDHFVPLYVAAGAGEAGNVQVVTSLYGAPTFAFGV
ncbi:hypothetical protein H0H87_012844 [Tephrocybe sp. NHM501043]|nr:hypothetical protein H0H87_012844 [Tephrocybe sp. NHM501043]